MAMSFVGREHELGLLDAELTAARQTGAGRLVWIRGRRRVGKSRLVEEFCSTRDAPYCFYQAPKRARQDALAEFAEAVRESGLPAAGTFADATFGSWLASLRASTRGAEQDAPVIVVIDELPYLAESDDGFTADLQKAWDRALQHTPVLLVCIGSDVRMMQTLVQARSPLHGRPTREMHVKPLNPADVATITATEDPREAFDRYLVIGGFPSLAASWPAGASLEDFLHVALADDQTRFVTDALRVQASEFEQSVQARKVIEVIGHGETAHGKIAARSQITAKTLDAALKVLVEQKQMVHKGLPYAAPPGTKASKYTITDPYLRFWLRFVGPHTTELARGRSDLAVARVLRDWPGYRGRAIEPVVRESVERLLADPSMSDRLGAARHVGSWWRRDHGIEVDLVGGDAPTTPTKIGFVGSIKWFDDKPFGDEDAALLAAHRAQVPGASAARLLAVSRTPVESTDVDVILRPADLLAAWRTIS